MRRAIINHCWTGHAGMAWYPWAARQLGAVGWQVAVPDMPDSDRPQRSTWLAALTQAVGQPQPDTMLIGHSLGCANLLNYLGQLAPGETVGTVILVAGLSHDLGIAELADCYRVPFAFERIRQRAARFELIVSDNDPYAQPHPMVHAEHFRAALGAHVTVVAGGGHFSPGEGCLQLPALAERVRALG